MPATLAHETAFQLQFTHSKTADCNFKRALEIKEGDMAFSLCLLAQLYLVLSTSNKVSQSRARIQTPSPVCGE